MNNFIDRHEHAIFACLSTFLFLCCTIILAGGPDVPTATASRWEWMALALWAYLGIQMLVFWAMVGRDARKYQPRVVRRM